MSAAADNQKCYAGVANRGVVCWKRQNSFGMHARGVQSRNATVDVPSAPSDDHDLSGLLRGCPSAPKNCVRLESGLSCVRSQPLTTTQTVNIDE